MEAMKRRKRNSNRRGAAMVEMALVLTLLMMLTLGAIEYGWLFLTMQRLTNAARQGARVASPLGATDTEGETAMNTLLAGVPTATADVTTTGANVTATVTVTTSAVRLVNWDVLPAPATLTASVTMAKEGAI
jgi:Flp pilus assembly protein TadG